MRDCKLKYERKLRLLPTLPLLLYAKLHTFLTDATMNPPDSGKDELKGSVPIVSSKLVEAGYEEDINLW